MTAAPKRRPGAREQLWVELFALAEEERRAGDGRALRLMTRYRDRLEKPKAKPKA